MDPALFAGCDPMAPLLAGSPMFPPDIALGLATWGFLVFFVFCPAICPDDIGLDVCPPVADEDIEPCGDAIGEDMDPDWATAAPVIAQKTASVQAIRRRFMVVVSSRSNSAADATCRRDTSRGRWIGYTRGNISSPCNASAQVNEQRRGTDCPPQKRI
jgi:hypothetical protein